MRLQLRIAGRAFSGLVVLVVLATSAGAQRTPLEVPTGAAGGDLAGTYPSPTIAKLQGTAISATPPTSGQVLGFNGKSWGPVAPSAGGDGTTGENSASVFGTSSSSLAVGASVTVPGLVTSINVPANSVTIISTDGGVFLMSQEGAGLAKVDMRVWVDGTPATNGGYRQLVAAGNVSLQAIWSVHMALELTPGLHTIEVKATNVSPGAPLNHYPYGTVYPSAPRVSGDAASGLQGTLTVTTLKR